MAGYDPTNKEYRDAKKGLKRLKRLEKQTNVQLKKLEGQVENSPPGLKQGKSEVYPLFYDAFKMDLASGSYFHESMKEEVVYGSPLHRYLLDESLKVLNRSQVRLLEQDVCKMLLDLSNKAGNTLVPYLPYPKMPMWVEFDRAEIGDKTTQFKAIWHFPFSFERTPGLYFQLIDIHGGSKSFFVEPETGEWQFLQGGACANKHCLKGGMTRDGETYTVSRKECLPLRKADCTCAGGALEMSKLVFLVGHIMHSIGKNTLIKEKVVSQQKPLPKKFNEQQLVKQWNKDHPPYVRLSLSQPHIEVHRKSAATTPGARAKSAAEHMELQYVSGSWKALIPGEGKPWKQFQLFYVDPYQRDTPVSSNPTRYIITE